MASSSPSPESLRAFAEEHLWYEVWMLSRLTDRLLAALQHDTAAGKRDLGWLDLETRNAQVEAFAIHARGLLDFFYPPLSRKRDDALALHYVEPVLWKPPPPTPALELIRGRVGKEIAHLTYGRLKVTEEAKKWDYGQIWLDMAHVVAAFIDTASRDRLPNTVAAKMLSVLPPAASRPALAMSASATHSDAVISPLDGLDES